MEFDTELVYPMQTKRSRSSHKTNLQELFWIIKRWIWQFGSLLSSRVQRVFSPPSSLSTRQWTEWRWTLRWRRAEGRRQKWPDAARRIRVACSSDKRRRLNSGNVRTRWNFKNPIIDNLYLIHFLKYLTKAF